jgi:hypothetical protein
MVQSTTGFQPVSARRTIESKGMEFNEVRMGFQRVSARRIIES